MFWFFGLPLSLIFLNLNGPPFEDVNGLSTQLLTNVLGRFHRNKSILKCGSCLSFE